MNPAAPRAGGRLALRIWLFTAAALLASGLGLWLVTRVAWRPPHRGPPAELLRYAGSRLARSWNDRELLRDELGSLRHNLRLGAALYGWNDQPIAAEPGPGPSGGPEPGGGFSPELGGRPPRRSSLSPGGGEGQGEGVAVPGSRAPLEGPRGPPPPALAPAPLSAPVKEALLRDGFIQEGDCSQGPCQQAVLVRGQAGPLGYLVVRPEPRPPPARGRPSPALPLAVFLGGLGIAAAVLGSSLARPLERLARTARALGAGDLSARTGLRRRDELGTVAQAFDEMADRVAALLRAQTELLANVAHELRTPLARIRLALELAAEGDAEAQRSSLAEIAEDLDELEGLVADVLASARMELARDKAPGAAPPLRLAELDPVALAEGVAERFRSRYPSRPLEVEAGSSLPLVLGDAGLLRRVLQNLVDNARKYAPGPSPIRIRLLRRGGGGLGIDVVDQGEGIAPEDLARLFTPFFRADRSRTRATGGVGLGLSLARSIVEAHGGTLTAESAPGAGTIMKVTLPTGEPEEEDEDGGPSGS